MHNPNRPTVAKTSVAADTETQKKVCEAADIKWDEDKQRIAGWVFPPAPRDPRAIKASLRYQLNRKHENIEEFKDYVIEDDLEAVNAAYDSWPANDSSLYSKKVIDALGEILAGFHPDRSAGYASIVRPGTKVVWMNDPTYTCHLAFLRLALISSYTRYELSEMTATEMLKAGLQDPRTPFIKDEPHTIAKAEQERWRLIWPLSVIDELVFAFMHRPQNKLDIKTYQAGKLTGPVYPCIGVGHDDEGLRTLHSYAKKVHGGEGIGDDDATGWDISVSWRSWILDAERRADCFARGQPITADYEARCEWFEELSINIATLSAHHVIMIGSDLIEIDALGIMASAHPSTGGSNTCMRLVTLYEAHKKAAMGTGDDCLERGKLTSESRTRLAARGIVTRDEHFHTGLEYDFNSLHILEEASGYVKGRFLNFEKLVARLLMTHGSYSPLNESGISAVSSGYYVLRNSPAELERYKVVVGVLGYTQEAVDAADGIESDED